MTETFDNQTWGMILVLFAVLLLLLSAISEMTVRLWRARRSKPVLPLYDWAKDDGWLDVLARDDEGEVLAVIPAAWRYR